MKITFLLLFCSLVNLIASPTYSQNTKISLSLKNATIEEVLNKIEDESEFYFLFNQKLVNVQQKVDIEADNEPIKDILDEILTKDIKYVVLDRQIILTPEIKAAYVAPIFQQYTVTGKISDINGGKLAGVNVLLKGTLSGAITDTEGKYTINVPDLNGIIVFSFIGYTPQEIPINGRSTIDAQLVESLTSLNEVVVTSLGIRREVRTLGYATSSVSRAEIAENRSNQTFAALQGKLSGVNITVPQTGPGGSTKIRIRGQSSFTGANTPLIVIDGMPLDNSRFESRRTNASDGGDGLSSLSPDYIESMTVLKGAAASALYGSRAKDGVIMITTKKRGDRMGLGVEYNVNYTTDTPVDFTDFQYEYGQGERGVRPTTAWPTSGTWSFGEKFQPGMTQILFDNEEVPYEPVYDRIKKFYDVGKNLTNSFTLSNRGENGGFAATYSNTNVSGIVPNSTFKKNSINIGFSQNISKKLTLDGSINYSIEDNVNPPQALNVYSLQVPLGVTTMANSMPLDLLEKYAYDETGNELVWGRFLPRTNPYFSIAKKFENIKRDRLFGNMLVKYQFTNWLYLQGRVAQDFYVRDQDYNIPTGYLGQGSKPPAGFVDGSYTQEYYKFRERNIDFLLGMTHKIGDFGLNVNFGGNQMYRRADYNSTGVQDFIQRDLYTISNGRVKDPVYSLSERAVNSLYGTAEVSYRNYLYLNLTGRNDWFSTLSPDNRSIFYPSITTSYVFSDALKSIMPDWLSFGKLRFGYAQVGDDNVAPYSNQLYYEVNANLFPNPANALIPVGTIRGSTIPNSNLRPLRVSEVEAGMDIRLFENALSFDFSVYNKISENQIVSAQVSNTSSYTSQLINVGRSLNKGFELQVTVTPIQTNSFSWDITANASYNTSEVLKLGENPADTMITVGSVREIVGRPLGQIYKYLQKRDEQGNKVFDKNSGFPIQGLLTNVGCNQPNWFGGISNTFDYKGIVLSALITYKLGKDYVTGGGNNSNYWRHGLHKGTLPGRDVGYVIGEGVNQDGAVNTTKADIQPYYEAVNNVINDQYISNAGYWKLSQINLSYDFTKLLPANFIIKGLRFSIVANNVATIKKWTVNMDPDEIPNSVGDNSDGSGFATLPLTRSLGFNLNVKF